MDNIIEFKKNNFEVENVLKSFESEEIESLAQGFMSLLELPDQDFLTLAPLIIDQFERSMNEPSGRLTLVQSLNARGLKAEDLQNEIMGLINEIENTNFSNDKKDFMKRILNSIVNTIMETEGIAKKYISVAIEKCHEDAIVPQYANVTDSGMDLFALEDYVIHPGQTALIPTGIKVAIPAGYELQVRPKSGRALKTKLRVANSPGTIDAGYRDEVKIIIENIEPPIKDITYEFDDDGHIKITSILHGSDMFIGKGEKFAQIVLAEVPKVVFYNVDNVLKIENDGRSGGFGSTGLK